MIKRIITKFLLVSLIAVILISLHATIYIIFLVEAGLNFKEISLINLFYLLILLVLETPGKMIVGILGKKISLVASTILHGIALALYSLADSLLGFISAEVFLATGTVLASGVLKTWLTDSLHLYQLDKKSKNIFYLRGKIICLIKLIAGFAGTYLGIKSLSLPLIIVSLGYWSLTILSLLIREEMHLQEAKTSNTYSIDPEIITQESVAYVWQDDIMFIIIALTIIIALGFPSLSPIWWKPYYSYFLFNCYLWIHLCLLIGKYVLFGRKITEFCSIQVCHSWKIRFPGPCKVIV